MIEDFKKYIFQWFTFAENEVKFIKINVLVKFLSKMNQLTIKQLQKPTFWLLAIATALIILNINLTLRFTTDFGKIIVTLLAWAMVSYNIWEKRQELRLESDIFSTITGLILLAFVLLRSLFSFRSDIILDILPLLSTIAVLLIATGWKNFKNYQTEILIIAALSVPQSLILELTHLATITAKVAAYILYHGGSAVQREGTYIYLAQKRVEVNAGCSGISSIMLLWRLSILFIVSFPLDFTKKILAQILAIIVGFIINTLRVVLITLLFSYSTIENFDFWHDGDGSQLFLLMETIIFGACCYYLQSLKLSHSLTTNKTNNHE
jgi:cyanoexosortase A